MFEVVHITNDIGAASGVGTFVRRVNDELVKLGVDSRIVKGLEGLGTRESNNLQSKNQTILHIHGLWRGLHHAAVKWAQKNGAKIVWSTHGMTAPWAMKHKWWKKCLPWYLHQKRDLKQAALIHCTSDSEVEWNRKLGLTKTFLAPLGTFLPEKKVVNSVVDLRSRPRILLFVGRIYPVKALDRLIEAFALADDSASDWVLRLVGPDQSRHMAKLMSLCDRLGLAYSTSEKGEQFASENGKAAFRPLVEFAGAKFGAELAAEYANCDCLALVSHTENFGATVADAMAHCKPVITSTNTPWRIVSERGCGWWVDNDPETLSRVIGEMMALSDVERAEMGRRGRKLVEEKFTWSAVGKMMVEAYESLKV